MNAIHKSLQLVYILLLVFLIGCDSNAQEDIREPEPLRPLSLAESEVVQSDNAFGLNLFTNLSAGEADKNVFISPLSVSMALGMTMNGADGNTREEMAATLQKQGVSEEDINASYRTLIDLLTHLDPGVDVNLANSSWYRDGFEVLPAFLDVNNKNFDAEIAALDFVNPASKNVINNWVDQKTNGLIDGIIDEINPEDVMYLINAIYFKGSWTYQFEESATKDQPFHNRDGSRPAVPLMNLTGAVPYASNETVRLIDLPYGDSLFSMTVILPNDPSDLDKVVADLDATTWDQWTSGLTSTNLQVFLPRFKQTYEKPLNEVLMTLGMADAFQESTANFSRITPNQRLYISKVMHKSLVEVNEEGTEAAAVTSVTVGTTSVGGNEPGIFRVDRPFIFSIRERHTGSILFIGKILNL